MRDLGFACWMVERFVPFPKPHGQRVDLFNIIDILAINSVKTIGVQSCGQDFAAHKTKILENEYTERWIESWGRELWLIGWRKLKTKLKNGKFGKGYRWTPRIGTFVLNQGIKFKEHKGEP